MLRVAYMLAAVNLKGARDKQSIQKAKDPLKFKVRDFLLIKNHKKQIWNIKYMPDFHICKVINNRPYDFEDPTGHVQHASVADIQLLMPAEYIVSMLPNIKAFGQAWKYINVPSMMPDLNWQHNSIGNVQTLDKNLNVTKHKFGL